MAAPGSWLTTRSARGMDAWTRTGVEAYTEDVSRILVVEDGA